MKHKYLTDNVIKQKEKLIKKNLMSNTFNNIGQTLAITIADTTIIPRKTAPAIKNCFQNIFILLFSIWLF